MHLVETMAYAGEKPWHGLGNKLAPQQPIEVWKRQAGMEWHIDEAEVRYVVGKHGVGAINAFPEQKVLYRSDSKVPLAVVSRRFQVVQPGEILEFYRDLTEYNGFELETAEGESLDEDEIDFALEVLAHARRLQQAGWDLYYRPSW